MNRPIVTEGRIKRRGVSLLAFALAASVLLQGCSTVSATPGLYIVDLEGGSPGWIADTTAAPVWSPGGDTIAWADEDGLRVHTVANNSTRTLNTEAVAGKPAWSPDGTALAYVSNESQELVVVEAIEGVDQIRVSISEDAVGATSTALPILGGPSWSPDGSRLAFSCWDGSGDEVCLIDRDGGNRTQLTNLKSSESAQEGAGGQELPAESNAGPASWSPDGLRMAVASYPERRGAPAGVFVIDLRLGTSSRISTLLPNSEIVWSRDGKAVLFSATQEGRSDALMLPISGAAATVLSGNLPHGARSPAVSPNHTRIAVSTSESIVVLEDTEASSQIGVEGLHLTNPAWSPTESAIAFSAALNPIGSYN